MTNTPKTTSKILKIFTWIVATTALFFLASIILLISLVNTKNFKNEVSALVQKTTHREFSIAGDMKLSFFPWMGVRISQATLGNAPGFGKQAFAQVGEADVKIRLLPLFVGKVVMETLTLRDVTLNLTENKAGQNNWSDFNGKDQNAKTSANTTKTTTAPTVSNNLPVLMISSINISNATINWNNQQTGQQATINRLYFSSNDVNLDRAFPVQLKFNLKSNQPTLNLSTDLHTNLLMNPAKQQYALQNLTINGNLIGKQYAQGKLPFALSSDLNVNLNNQTLQAQNLKVKLANLAVNANLNGQQILQTPVFAGQISIPNFNPRALLTALGQKIKAQDTVLQNASLQASAQFSPKFLKLNNIQAKLDNTTMSGRFAFANFNTKNFDFDLKLNQLNLDRYLNPTANNKNVVMGANNTWQAQAALAQTNALIPTQLLRSLNGQGSLQIGQLTVTKLNLANVYTQVSANHGVIKVAPLTANLYQGKAQGDVTIDARGNNPAIAVNETLTNVQVGQLISDLSKTSKIQVSGTGNLALNLQTQGQTSQAMTRALNGKIHFAINNGTITNLNVAQQIYATIAKVLKGNVNNSQATTESTNFASLTGNIVINNGIASNNDLLLQSTALRIAGQGNANLINQTINYNLAATALGSPFGRDVLDLQEQIGGKIPLRVSGTFSNPSIAPDLAVITADLLKGRARQQIEKHFGSTKWGNIINNKNVQNFLNQL